MRIDAHQHYWSPAHGDYGWLVPSGELHAIYRPFGPPDLHPLLDACGVHSTVLVQAAPTEAETWRLLELAGDPRNRVLGVVGWCDLESPAAPRRILDLAKNPLLKGLRPMLQDLPDVSWMLGGRVRPAFDAMAAAGLTLDLLIKPHQLDFALALAHAYPRLRMVIDHGAKPAIAAGEFATWAAKMARLAVETPVMCKLSGLMTEAGAAASAGRLQPYVEHLAAAFGPARLMWGSDWPVLNLAGSYEQWHGMCRQWLSTWTPAQQAAVFGGNAARFYRLGQASSV